MENQYQDVPTILVPLETLVPLAISPNLRGITSFQLINFQDPIHKNDFHIYDQLRISNFSQELAPNQHICVATQNNSSLSDISSTLLFWKASELQLQQNSLILNIPDEKVTLTFFISKSSLKLYQKKQQRTIKYVIHLRTLVPSRIY